jgi:hypothetical protein
MSVSTFELSPCRKTGRARLLFEAYAASQEFTRFTGVYPSAVWQRYFRSAQSVSDAKALLDELDALMELPSV